MDPDGNWLSCMILLLVLVAGNAFFVMSETSIIALNDNKLRKMAGEGNRNAATILRLTAAPSRFLTTLQIGATLSGLLASAFAASGLSGYVARMMGDTALSPQTVWIIGIVVITLLLCFIMLVFGMMIPKRIAMQYYEKIAFSLVGLVSLVSAITRPFVWLLTATSGGILRLFGIDLNKKPEEVTEEEIRMMIDVGGQSGTIEQAEKDMLNNIFEFDDSTAEGMMTHRTEMTAVEVGTPLAEIIALAVESGHSRIPVYEEDLDSIIGVLYVKDLLGLIISPTDEFDLRRYMRKPLYAMESTRSVTLLSEFKQKKIQIAIVVDEYGGTSGIVTMEDLLEEIVGNIQDEYDDEEEDITNVGDGSYLVDGLAPLDDVLGFFELEIEDADDYDTIGGYVVDTIGYIPEEDAHPSIKIGDILFTVEAVDDRHIQTLLAQPQSEQATSDTD